MRTTEAEILRLMDSAMTEDQVTPFLRTANGLVTDLLASVEALTDARRAEIEAWLGAHFASIRDPAVKSDGIDTANFTYETAAVSEGLKATRYGQQAIMLDISGTLASLASGKRPARFTAL
jgi:hypothetical protein